MPDALPTWPAGTVAVLATTGDDGPHAIPVSAVLRAGDDRLLLGLARRRGSLARLREHPHVAVTLLDRDVAVTARGRAVVLAEELEDAPNVAAVEVRVSALDDHDHRTFALEGGVPWRWTDDEAAARDARTRAALTALLRPRD